MLDYIILGVPAAVGVGIGLLTLSEAKKLKAKRDKESHCSD